MVSSASACSCRVRFFAARGRVRWAGHCSPGASVHALCHWCARIWYVRGSASCAPGVAQIAGHAIAGLPTSDGVDCAARASGEAARALGIDAVATVLCTPGSHRLSEANLRLAQGKAPLSAAEQCTLQRMVGVDEALTVPLQANAGITGSVPAGDKHWEGMCRQRPRHARLAQAGCSAYSSASPHPLRCLPASAQVLK